MNAFFFMPPKDIFSHTFNPRVILRNFLRPADVEDGVQCAVNVMTSLDSIHKKPKEVQCKTQEIGTTMVSSKREKYLDRLNHCLFKFAFDRVLKGSDDFKVTNELEIDRLLNLDTQILDERDNPPEHLVKKLNKQNKKCKKLPLKGELLPKEKTKRVKKGKIKKDKKRRVNK